MITEIYTGDQEIMEPKDESISPEEYGALMEKLTNVEELFAKQVIKDEQAAKDAIKNAEIKKAAQEDKSVAETLATITTSIEKMSSQIVELQSGKGVEEDISKTVTGEDIQKMLTDAIKDSGEQMDARLKKLEGSPFAKGAKDSGDLGAGAAGSAKEDVRDGLVDEISKGQYGIKEV